MADNFVQIRIKATDTAKPDLDELRADLDELGSKVDTAKVEVDDDEAKLKLLEINAQLAALNKRVASPKIDVASAARAQSQVEKLGQDFDRLIHKVDESNSSSGGRGLFSKLLYGAEGEGGGGGGSGGLTGILGSAGEGGGGILAGVAAVIPALAAVLVEVDGLASGIAAAGAGAGAFAALSIPAFDKVKTAVTSLKADQLAYADATTKAARSSALKKIHDDWKALDPAERGAVKGVQDFMSTFDKMSKAFEPEAFKVFNSALKIANELLPHLTPFANTFANALNGLLKQVAKFADSKGFRDWLKQFHQLEGPSITAIGHGLGQVAIAFGKLLTIMSKKDVVNAINIAFKVLADTIGALGFIIQRIMLRWNQWQQLFRQVGHTTTEVGHEIESVFDQIAAAIARWAARVAHNAMAVVSFFRSLPGRIVAALAALPGMLFSAGAHAIAMLASGIRSAIGDVTGAIGSVVSEITSHLPFSPAKKGPLSGRGDPVQAGRRISQMLAQGMTDGTSAVSHAADRVAGAAAVGGHGGGGGRPIQLEVRVPRTAMILGTDFWTAFQNGVRAKGGDPRIVQAKVVFQ